MCVILRYFNETPFRLGLDEAVHVIALTAEAFSFKKRQVLAVVDVISPVALIQRIGTLAVTL